jgi:hypothetical protein
MGDTIKTMSLQGKEYAKVCDRLSYFHKTYPDGIIITDVTIGAKSFMVKATVKVGGKTKATGHGVKPHGNEFTLEKCETRAIGRALGIMGIGSDGSISTYEEVAEAKGVKNGE